MTIGNEDVVSLTARAVAAWVDGHVDLLAGLVALRALGADADRAVQEVLAVRELRKLSLSLELFELLAGSGRDLGHLLLDAAPSAHVRLLATALVGGAARPSAS